jgi:hypothetical protein
MNQRQKNLLLSLKNALAHIDQTENTSKQEKQEIIPVPIYIFSRRYPRTHQVTIRCDLNLK